MTIMMNGSDSDAYMEGYQRLMDLMSPTRWSKGRNSERKLTLDYKTKTDNNDGF